MSITTLRVTRDTRERLKQQGRKGQTYDELINQLVDAIITGFESLKTNPTTTGQSLVRPGQSIVGKKSIQGSDPTDG
jgi:hypothetical protein